MRQSSTIAPPTLPSILSEWVDGLQRLVGEKVLGLYLAGSLSYGDFVPERSDIDLQAVVRIPLTDDELCSVEQLHRKMEGTSTQWANRVECSYVPLAFMGDITPPKTPRPWWGFGRMYAEALAGNEWTINHYLLSKHGVPLYGPEFSTLAPPISVADVQRACVRDLLSEWLPKINDNSWFASSHHQSYLVLNLCRILYTAIAGEVGTKKTAAAWAKATYCEWKALIEAAERWSYGDEIDHRDGAAAFVTFSAKKVSERYTPNTF